MNENPENEMDQETLSGQIEPSLTDNNNDATATESELANPPALTTLCIQQLMISHPTILLHYVSAYTFVIPLVPLVHVSV